MTNPVVPLYQTVTANQTPPNRHYDLNVPGAGSEDGILIGQTPTTPVGFFGVMPAVPPAPSGNVSTPTAGSTTGVFVNTTFDGSLGTTAYTIGDIVAALKAIGVLAQ